MYSRSQPKMSEWFAETAGSGSLVLAVPVALIAGLVSFFSPCVIPLLPGYLSYATGLSGADIASGDARRGRMLAGALLFVLGFTIAFVLLGAFFGAAGGWLLVNKRLLSTIFSKCEAIMSMSRASIESRPTCRWPAAPTLRTPRPGRRSRRIGSPREPA